jgi:thioredoxin 1
MSDLIEVNDKNFKSEVLEGDGKVLVDFWAPWCGPCKMQTPILEKIAESGDLNVKITKLNTDENPETAQNFGIHSIPTIIIFEKGSEVERLIGVQPENILKEKLK